MVVVTLHYPNSKLVKNLTKFIVFNIFTFGVGLVVDFKSKTLAIELLSYCFLFTA